MSSDGFPERMAGRMGGDRVTAENRKVVEIDAARNILLLKGSVPGKKDNLLIIRKVA